MSNYWEGVRRLTVQVSTLGSRFNRRYWAWQIPISACTQLCVTTMYGIPLLQIAPPANRNSGIVTEKTTMFLRCSFTFRMLMKTLDRLIMFQVLIPKENGGSRLPTF